ncbi:MAG: TonB-dependent receptor [Prevotella sp.]|nr:TonB-dependent receptor [Prevotella sp.]
MSDIFHIFAVVMKKTILLVICGIYAAVTHAQTLDSLGLQEVVVTGSRSVVDIRHLPMTVTVISKSKLTEQHQTSVLPTVMQKVPGVFVTSRSMMGYGVSTGAAGGINMRGITGGAGQLMVLIDGHPQYQGIYGHPISDSYQTMMAERVEVLRGPASMLYGSNAMGGVINIVTRRPEYYDDVVTQLTAGAGSYGTVQSELSNQVRSGSFSSTIAGQYNRTDNHRPRMGFEQYGGYVQLGYDLNHNWNAYVNADLTRSNASYPGSTDKPMYNADQWITRGVVSAGIENRYRRSNGALSIYSNFGRHKIDDGTTDPAKPTARYFRSKDALTGISWYQSYRIFDRIPTQGRITVGFDYQHIYGNAYYTSKETGEVMDTPNKQSGKSYRNEVAGYVDYRQDLASWLTLDAGIRLDHHSITGTEWVPQAGIVVRPIDTGEVRALVSKGFRNPTMREMYLYPPSNTELEPERIWNYELSWHHQVRGISYGINAFYIKGDNMIQTIPVDGKPRNVNTGEIENYGVEMELRYPFSRFVSAVFNASYLHMKNKVVGAPETMTFEGIEYRNRKWFANIGLQTISGLYTAVGDAAKKESFQLLSASVTYPATKNLSLWARGENLLAQKYEINLGYPMPRATFMAGISLKLEKK